MLTNALFALKIYFSRSQLNPEKTYNNDAQSILSSTHHVCFDLSLTRASGGRYHGLIATICAEASRRVEQALRLFQRREPNLCYLCCVFLGAIYTYTHTHTHTHTHTDIYSSSH